MVCSAPIAPAATMVGGLRSHPQTCVRNFPAIFWLIVMSWCAVLGKCGCISWLRSEPCFVSPIGLGGNWYILLQPQKILIQTMAQRSKCHHQLHYPPQWHSFHIHHMLIYYLPPPTQAAQASTHASSSVASRQPKLMTTQWWRYQCQYRRWWQEQQ